RAMSWPARALPKACSMACLATAVTLVATGCGVPLYEKPREFKYQDEAGTARISIVSVTRWDEIRQKLLPAFSLAGPDALGKVAQTAKSQDESFLTAFSSVLAAAAAEHGVMNNAPAMPTAPSLPAFPQFTTTTAPTTTPAIEASAQYRLALALYQEVA